MDEQRGVTREDADVAVDPVADHFGGLSGPHLALRRDDVHLERHYAASRVFACSTASSIPPTRKNACSGRWSYSPSQSALKDAIVSSIGVYLPGRPVNCSATKNGCDRNRWILRDRETINLSSSESSSIPRIAMMCWRSRYRWRISWTRRATS